MESCAILTEILKTNDKVLLLHSAWEYSKERQWPGTWEAAHWGGQEGAVIAMPHHRQGVEQSISSGK